MRVLMISANTEQINVPVLPLGLARVAAAVEQAGHEIRVVNLMRPEHVSRELPGAISDFEPEAIGISVRNIDDQNRDDPTFLLPRVKPVVDECRRLSQAPVVLGGPGYSIFPGSVLAYLEAEYGIQGQGERAMPLLLDRIRAREPVTDIPGLILPGGHFGPRPEQSRSLDDSPLPRPGKHLIVPGDVDPKQLWVPFQTRMGCPMQCSYCSTPAIEGRTMRYQSPELVVDNLEAYAAAGYRRFFFVDNVFNLPSGYAETICQVITEADLDISWQAIVYPRHLNPPLVEKMARAGCTHVSLGFESGSSKMLAGLNKRFTPKEVREANALFRQAGIVRTGFLLLGGPGETRETVEASLAFAESLDLDVVKLTCGLRIYPETLLARQAAAKGLIAPGADLLRPVFYLEADLDGWLQEKAARMVEEKDHWHN
ncbi:MAG: radical SAM protein [Desulfohalobiaceae bacterium]|nr:radical SAM protein [Desulfohalobiaceae bacterium]